MSHRRSVFGGQDEQRVIVLHWEGKQHLLKLFDGISRKEMLDYVYDILEISVNIKLKFDDF